MKYYIICKRHAYKKDFAILFWGKNFSGYTYNIENAGVYTGEEVRSRNLTPCADDIAEEGLIKSLAERYVIDNAQLGLIVRSINSNWKLLNIKASELYKGNTVWDERAFCTPDEFVNKNKNTVKILEAIKELSVNV